ncbi:bacteriocin [Flavobacterium hercynium]|uniref:Bacteriocin n=1 Tax=Flavobacterium hercynium TaxID=387094 RepID=A0A226GNJ4_9FLAO|nr:bacteriocin [Flavobacterium hercynium]OXA82970.1 hypothetical protein B0A66_22660 [Flavobacterium hercynium]SMP10569.1 bacteriocin-type signal sequence-containing protein [Flavobacterium hercynium]
MKELQSFTDFSLTDEELNNVSGGYPPIDNTGAGTFMVGNQVLSYTSDCDYGNGHIQYANVRG